MVVRDWFSKLRYKADLYSCDAARTYCRPSGAANDTHQGNLPLGRFTIYSKAPFRL